VDSRETDVEVALSFAENAAKIAPCYYVSGNHEGRISGYGELKAGLIDRGITVLENAVLPIRRGEDYILLIGVIDPSFQALSDEEAMRASLQSLDREQDAFTVLLSHRPELFHIYVENNIDLVFSGHAHGGQVRLPFIGGLYAPHQGLFPEYDAGVYTQDGTTMLVSRGVGNSLFPLRLNNRPEVLLIELDK
jgi:predicted MPP superfamily phosphohydrolase